MVLFADDSTVVIKYNNVDDYEIEINNTVKDIIKWLNMNNLLINLKKTKIMHFHQRILPLPICCNYDGTIVESVSGTKFLGVHLDNHLSWNTHTEEVCRKLNQYAFALYKLAKQVSPDAVLTAYHGFVASTLRYGIIFWGNSLNREAVFKAQKRCIRAMRGLHQTDSCVSHFKEMKLLTMPSLYIFEAVMFIKNNPALFKKIDATGRPLRQRRREDLCTFVAKTALMRKSVYSVAIKIYNKLPSELKLTPIPVLKRKLMTLLLSKCYYSISTYLNDDFN
jgi:hypothetical protein